MKGSPIIQVKWEETVCIHSANCVKKLPNVFKVAPLPLRPRCKAISQRGVTSSY
jgi:uncharacterized Fe-S cluster protein YjdI